MSLRWESAGTDEPRDQTATSHHASPAWWEVGPHGDLWSCVLLDPIDGEAIDVTPRADIRYMSEEAAKAAAQDWEDARDDVLSPVETLDYCPPCGENVGHHVVTQWAGETCLCCGHEWGMGDDENLCHGRHVEGALWSALLDGRAP